MSELNQKNPANNGENEGAQAQEPKAEKEKKSFIKRAIKLRDRIRNSKAGRILVGGLKLAGVGGIAFASYKAGAKSVKPTTIYIREGVDEEEEKPVENTTEPAEEKEETGEMTE